jgi:chromosome segregation ATPase
MAQELSTALKTAKSIEKELTVAENRLAYVQEEVKRLTASKEAIQDDLAKKSADYELYIGKRDADSKKMRQDVLDERAQLERDKVEFQTILQTLKQDKQAHESSKEEVVNLKKRNEATKSNIDQFIIAVQRAFSLLG